MNAWPWLVALLLFGLPHGAMDAVVNEFDQRRRRGPTGLRGFIWYLAWMALCASALVLAPIWTCLAFFALTAAHFGAADMFDIAGSSGSEGARSGFQRFVWWVSALARGSLVLAIPFAVDPQGAWAPFGAVTRIGIGPDIAPLAAGVGLAVTAVSIAALGLVLVLNPLGLRKADRLRFGVESAAAAAMLALLPPLFAVGVYFLAVHALKHSLRLVRCDGLSSGEEPQKLWRRLVSMHQRGLILTVPSLFIIGVWAWMLGGPIPEAIASASIGFYIVTTLPHELLGHRLELLSDSDLV